MLSRCAAFLAWCSLASAAAPEVQKMTSLVREVRSGPWGRVLYVPLQISPTLESAQTLAMDSAEIRWRIMLDERDKIAPWLAAHGVPQAAAQQLAAGAQKILGQNGWNVYPTEQLLLSFDRETRVALYTALGQWRENPRHRNPFRLVETATKGWWDMMHLSPDLQKIFEQLTYQRGSLRVFTDIPVMMQELKDEPEEQSQFLRAIASESTYLATLRVLPGDDVDELAHYWGTGGREGEVRPLLEAAVGTGGEIGVPVPLLLPGFARRVLYTYPSPHDTRFLDCHYSSINFYNREPDERMLEGMFRDTFFNAFYQEVPAPTLLGDVIVLVGPDGEAVHSCAQVAGDLVFTKNGGQRALPWMLMTLKDALDYYSIEGPLTLKYFRRSIVEDR